MLNILMFGRTGQVARELVRAAHPDVAITPVDREQADLRDPEAAARLIRSARADLVINAAAYTAVDQAEENRRTASVVNAEAPGAMAAACAARNMPFLHISTDYVFDGQATKPLAEDAATGPLNHYGKSKLAGEQAIAAAGGDWLVLRTSWVFSAHGRNFARTMLGLTPQRKWVGVVDDQRGAPTAASDIAATLLRLARRRMQGQGTGGVFHYCGMPATSWFGFAREIFWGGAVPHRPELLPIRTEEWPTPAARPRYTALDCAKIRDVHGIKQPSWIAALDDVRAELAGETA